MHIYCLRKLDKKTFKFVKSPKGEIKFGSPSLIPPPLQACQMRAFMICEMYVFYHVAVMDKARPLV